MLWLHGFVALAAAAIPAGQIVDAVTCKADPSQSYAVYLPSAYLAGRSWPVIFAFDPRARGRLPAERFQAAAEAYGYIIAASNNSRNGPWADSIQAAKAMAVDVVERFNIDSKRVYTTGMSGGARVALGVALGSNSMAGVIACSGGYPDGKRRKELPFAFFGTAGSEDFNLLEMRRIDRELKSAHRLRVFEGGHVWLSSELATEAVEWMEIQAIKSRITSPNPALIDRIFEKRSSALTSFTEPKETLLALEALVADFEGLKDVSGFASRATQLRANKQVRKELSRDLADEREEQRELTDILALESRLGNDSDHAVVITQLRNVWQRLSALANKDQDSAERRMARRIMRGLAVGAQARITDQEYLRMVAEFSKPR